MTYTRRLGSAHLRFLILYTGLYIADMLLTFIGFKIGLEELNPLDRWLYGINPDLFIAVRTFLLLMVIQLCLLLKRRFGLNIVPLLYGIISVGLFGVFWNIRMLILFW